MTRTTSRSCSVVKGLTHPEQRRLEPTSAGRTRTRSVITPAPATPPAVPPRPQGDLDTATLQTINALVDEIWSQSQPRCSLRRAGLRWLLGHLEGHPGRSWQQRWVASGLNDGDRRIRELTTGDLRLDGELGHSLLLLCCLRVIRPSLAAFRVNSFVRYHEHFEVAQNDPNLERFLALDDMR